MVETAQHTRLGALLLEGNLIRAEDLERCLELQALTGGSRPLGQILVEQDVITRDELEQMLELQQRRAHAGVQHHHQTDAHRDQESPPPWGESADVPLRIEDYLVAAAEQGATELIFSEGRPPLVRGRLGLSSLDERPVQSPEMWQFLLDHMGSDVLDKLAEQQFVAKEFHKKGVGRGRITSFRHFNGACAVVRLQPEGIRSVEESGIPAEIVECVTAQKGLVLLTGQTGSGITSTMASLLDEIAKGDPKLVVVLDENQEYELQSWNADVVFRRVGRDTRNYETGLESAIRENPDVLVVADVSSPRAFDLALRAAEGGCLVLAALNAKDIQSALLRALNFYPSYDVQRIRNTLASVLMCVLRLQLVPAKGGRGQVMASELLLLDSASRSVLRDGQLSRLGLLMVMERSGQGCSMDRCLEDLLVAGKIELEDGFRFADDKTRFLKRARGKEPVRD